MLRWRSQGEKSRRRAVGKWKTRRVFQGGAAAVFSTAMDPMLRCERRRRQVAEAAVRSELVVILPHQRRLDASLEQVPEKVWNQVFVFDFAVQALGAAVLGGLAGRNKSKRPGLTV